MNRPAILVVAVLALLLGYIWTHNYTYTRWNGYQARVHRVTHTLEVYSPGLRGWARVGLSSDEITDLLKRDSEGQDPESDAESDYYSDPGEKASRAAGR